MISPESKTLVLVRGKPFSGKTQLASLLAQKHPDIYLISKDAVAEEMWLNRSHVEYTDPVRKRLYESFRKRVAEALQWTKSIVIAEAPFSRSKDVSDFIRFQQTEIERILVITVLTSETLRRDFIKMGRCDTNGFPRELRWFEQDHGASGEFDRDIELTGCEVQKLYIRKPFSVEKTVQKASNMIFLI